jgi:hypothetical protein
MDESGFMDGFKTGKPVYKSKKSPFDFMSMSYDDRKGPSVDAGTRYGVGRPQPIGRLGDPETTARALPMGRVSTMKVDEV